MTQLHDDWSPRLRTRLGAWLDRVAPPGRIARDALFAVAVTLLTAALLSFTLGYAATAEEVPIDPSLLWLVVSIACLQAMLLTLRRRYPLGCFVAVVVIQLALLTTPGLTIRGPAAFVAAYTLGTLWSARRAQLAAGVAALAELLVVVIALRAGAGDLLLVTVSAAISSLLTYSVPVLVGTAVATRRRYTDLLRERATDAVAAERASVQAALVAERARMARELHDVAAHHLSGMVVQAAAVERLVGRDPAAARAGAAWIRTQGRETLDNLRLTVGVLRETGSTEQGSGAGGLAETSPVPGLAVLEELVDNARTLGTPVRLHRRGSAHPLPPIADIACYRVAQEALSNARQHAPGATVSVLLDFVPGEVRLEVSDDGSGSPARPRRPGAGVGLLGMRERAELIGARFTSGPVPSGGWRVRLVVPVAALDRGAMEPGTGQEQHS